MNSPTPARHITDAFARAEKAALTISVIMPVYNAAAYLPRALPPLIEMMRRGEVLEVIAVDDTSSDDSAAIAAKPSAQFP